MSAPVVLIYNLDNSQKLKLMFLCAQLKIVCLNVAREDYAQPIAALAGVRKRTPEIYEGEGFGDPMLVMANFTNSLFQAFLNALRRNKVVGIALKAVMTPTNSDWNSVRLHDEILKEHNEMHKK